MTNTLLERSRNCIAQGALTNSKRPQSLIEGVYPTHVVSAQNSILVDHTGKHYVDFICGLGTNLFGYGNEQIRQRVAIAIREGVCPSLPTATEVVAAEKLKELLFWCDRFKFVKTGSEACAAAIRIARNATGRKLVLSDGYHGWSEHFVSLLEPSYGVCSAEELHMQKFTSVDQITSEVAAVIVEPVMTDSSPARQVFLNAVRAKCSETGTILIFDEIITGLRFSQLTVSRSFSIVPDLTVVGKAIANGFPIAAVGGKKELMDEAHYFVSGTYAGDTVSLTALTAVLDLVATNKYDINVLLEDANKFVRYINTKVVKFGIRINGYGSRGIWTGNELNKAIFWQECCLAGVLFGPSFFYNYCHTQELVFVESVIEDVVSRMSAGNIAVKGKLPQSPFAQRARQ